jgi:hypothetical protein
MTRIVRGIATFVLVAISILMFPVSPRVLGLLFIAITLLVAAVSVRWPALRRRLLPLSIVTLAVTLSPFDVSLYAKPGPPRFVPVVMGLPSPELLARCERGDAFCGGCVVRGFEPQWVLIW